MEPFKKFITEQFMIARSNMPQINDVDEFVSYLNSIGIENDLDTDLVNHFKPTQSVGFDEYKIRNIQMQMRKYPDSKMTPIIVSSDGYVIDGHHRYLASSRTQTKIPFILVHTTTNKLLKIAYEYTSSNQKS
ncbi:MAG: hypothetical protein R3230_00700 [Nitrosopumilaceae archaeon]|nr:hypothetical protein [Nitrosopumilaceae archaeon]